MNKLLLFLLIIFGSVSAVAQDQYSPDACSSFVQVYMGQKKIPQSSPDTLLSLLDKHGIDRATYASLLKGDSAAAQLRNEKKFRDLHRDILRENERLEQRKEIFIRKSCLKSQISYERYLEMLHRYKTEITFQRSLKRYFDDYIKSLK